MIEIFKDPIVLLASMIFCHIIDDYGLQGVCLCNLKQKSFWEKNAPDKEYEKDYIAALICHAISWSFMILLIPMLCGFITGGYYLAVLVSNIIIHSVVDHCKANLKIINLIKDQLIHLLQIVGSWLIIVVILI